MKQFIFIQILLILFTGILYAEAEWTVMIYMAGDNDLGENQAGLNNINALEAVGSTETVQITALLDRKVSMLHLSEENWTGARTYHILKDNDSQRVTSQILFKTYNFNTGDPANLENFITLSTDKFPAKRYMLILWGHGTGWQTIEYNKETGSSLDMLKGSIQLSKSFMPSNLPDLNSLMEGFEVPDSRSICYDDSSADSLTLFEVASVFEKFSNKNNGKKIDILGFDACLMNMTEVAWEFADHAEIIIGSEEITPSGGWPFTSVIEVMNQNASLGSEEISKMLIKNFSSHYEGQFDVLQSAINTQKLLKMRESVKKLVTTLINNPEYTDFYKRASEKVLRFNTRTFADFGTVCKVLAEEIPQIDIKNAALEVMETLKNAVIGCSYSGDVYKSAFGLSIYWPTERYEDAHIYDNLIFSQQTGWNKWVKSFLNPPIVPVVVKQVLVDDNGTDGVFQAGEYGVVNITLVNESTQNINAVALDAEFEQKFMHTGKNSSQVKGPLTGHGGTINFSVNVIAPPVGKGKDNLFVEIVPEKGNRIHLNIPVFWTTQTYTQNRLLVVDSMLSSSGTENYAGVAGLNVDLWNCEENGPINREIIELYHSGTIIVVQGNSKNRNLVWTKDTINLLTDYLSNGGKLLIAGQDSGSMLKNTEFLKDWCQVGFIQDDSGCLEIKGISSSINMTTDILSLDSSMGEQKFPDMFLNKKRSLSIYNYTKLFPGNKKYSAGIIHDGVFFKTAFLGFGPEGISDLFQRQSLYKDLLNYLEKPETDAGNALINTFDYYASKKMNFFEKSVNNIIQYQVGNFYSKEELLENAKICVEFPGGREFLKIWMVSLINNNENEFADKIRESLEEKK